MLRVSLSLIGLKCEIALVLGNAVGPQADNTIPKMNLFKFQPSIPSHAYGDLTATWRILRLSFVRSSSTLVNFRSPGKSSQKSPLLIIACMQVRCSCVDCTTSTSVTNSLVLLINRYPCHVSTTLHSSLQVVGLQYSRLSLFSKPVVSNT